MTKNTKIVATISDLNCEVELLTAMYNEGMNVVRINSAHSTFEGATRIVENTRTVSDTIAILLDTKGPEIRVTKIEGKGITVAIGQKITIRGSADKDQLSTENSLYVNDEHFARDVTADAKILIDDGDIELIIEEVVDQEVRCRVINGGVIKSRKGVNVPGVIIELPSLTDKDRAYIDWGIKIGIDFIAHSFVRTKEDIIDIQEILDHNSSPIKIIAKIENQEGVDNIDQILDYTYGIMVARGDLGVELPSEQIPVTQRMLVKKCIESKKPVIIATQMLHSMIHSPRPTRAEVSDVANAIYQRVDAIMLSGETAQGIYPIESVRTMSTIARRIEQEVKPITDISMVRINNEVTAQLSRSAVNASVELPIRAILVDTLSGRTARYVAAFRGSKPVYALCYQKHVMRQLALSYGIKARFDEMFLTHDKSLYQMLKDIHEQGKVTADDLIVVVGGSFGALTGASYIEISTVTHLAEKLNAD